MKRSALPSQEERRPGNDLWVMYVGDYSFSGKEAASRRVTGIGQALARYGWNVMIGCGDERPVEPESLPVESDAGSLGLIGLGERAPKTAPVVWKVIRRMFTAGRRTVRWLDRQENIPCCIIYYGTSAPFLLQLLRWCRRNRVALLVDVVEWHDPRHTAFGGIVSPLNVSAALCLRLLNVRTNGVIAISSFLERYYVARKVDVIRVPPLLDPNAFEVRSADGFKADGRITLAYAGSSGRGRKDLIQHVAEAVLRLNARSIPVQLVVLGMSPEEMLDSEPFRVRRIAELPSCIRALGWQPPEDALKAVAAADFMPLLRPDARFAHAGFPTKVAESLANGTPVICNLTSDIGDVVREGIEGFVCHDHSVDALVAAILRAYQLSISEYAEMRSAARRQAMHSFDYRPYSASLGQFISRVSAKDKDVNQCDAAIRQV